MKELEPEEEINSIILFAEYEEESAPEERSETLPVLDSGRLRSDREFRHVKYLINEPDELYELTKQFQHNDQLTGYDGVVVRQGFFEENEVDDFTVLAFDTMSITQYSNYNKHENEELPAEYASTIGKENWRDI